MSKALFITARFRSGSTLLWNIFRQVPEVLAFYEPLHEKLPQMIQYQIIPQPSHDYVDTYFKEYSSLNDLIHYHSSEFGIYRLYLSAGEEYLKLKTYINYLLEKAINKQVPVLQFNRVDFRLEWLKENFPQIPIIHLYRSSREQWISSISQYPNFSEQDIDIDPYLITTWSRDLCGKFPFLAAPFIHHAYQRHYYLWKLSYLAGIHISDLSISYEELITNPQVTISKLLEFADLDVESNLERCTSVVVQKPLNKSYQYYQDEWFSNLEKECETVLSKLSLNQDFAQISLEKIFETNSTYQSYLTDKRVNNWLIKNIQLTNNKLEMELNNKEIVIQNLKKICDQRSIELKQKENLIQNQKKICDQKEVVIQQLKQACDQREAIIRQFHQSSTAEPSS